VASYFTVIIPLIMLAARCFRFCDCVVLHSALTAESSLNCSVDSNQFPSDYRKKTLSFNNNPASDSGSADNSRNSQNSSATPVVSLASRVTP
jgi:hypothetical protein